MTDLREVRQEFLACDRWVYLDAAARTPMSRSAAAAINRYVRDCQLHGARKEEWLAQVEDIRIRVARFVGAMPDDLAFVRNTSDGLNTIAAALDLRDGDNVVICPELEHGNNVYMWLHMRARGVDIRFVDPRDGAIDVDRVVSVMDARTRVVSVSSVSFVTGGRTDLEALGRECRRRGVFLLVDGAQSLGLMETNLRELPIDGLAAGGQKGLLGVYGAGVLYCHRNWVSRLNPPFLSRNAIDLGDAPEAALGPLDDYVVKSSAGRFEVGNPNFMGILALGAGVALLASIGSAAIENHVLALAGKLMSKLEDRFPLATPRLRENHASIVAFHHPQADSVVDQLEARGVRISARRGVVRISFHVYNDDSDIEALLEALDDVG